METPSKPIPEAVLFSLTLQFCRSGESRGTPGPLFPYCPHPLSDLWQVTAPPASPPTPFKIYMFPSIKKIKNKIYIFPAGTTLSSNLRFCLLYCMPRLYLHPKAYNILKCNLLESFVPKPTPSLTASQFFSPPGGAQAKTLVPSLSPLPSTPDLEPTGKR